MASSFEEKQNKIDVLSEEPYPLRRGRATGRANRLMMYDDDKDDDAHDGPALRSSGTCGWFLRCPGWQREPRGMGVYTYIYHLSTIMLYYLRAVIRGESRWNPSDDRVIVRTPILHRDHWGKKGRKRDPTAAIYFTLSGRDKRLFT